MTGKGDFLDAVDDGGAYEVERHFADIAPVHSGAAPNAADLKASGAAARMWQKVEEDLDRIDNTESDEVDNG
jgi:hypothetical protein